MFKITRVARTDTIESFSPPSFSTESKIKQRNALGDMFSFPTLPNEVQQLAGNLPLSALIEFIDVPAKLHIYELTSSVPLWNWPITPVGARTLLAKHNNSTFCSLDRPEKSAVLECFDGRHGDRYPSSTPTTTRLWASMREACHEVSNSHPNMRDPLNRCHTLDVLFLSDIRPQTTSEDSQQCWHPFSKQNSLRYNLTCILGWASWCGLVVLAIFSRLGFAAAYLLLMPICGLVIGYTHGGRGRVPIRRKRNPHDRLVVATDSVNACDWWAFYGDHNLVNPLLNMPLSRPKHMRRQSPFFLWILRVLIIGQWALALGSCAFQGWDAIFISFWITFCACMSSYAYPTDVAVQDWMLYRVGVEVRKIRVKVSSRRALLSTLVCLNPDDCTSWMDSILTKSPERQQWEQTLISHLQAKQVYMNVSNASEYWWKYIQEGLQVGAAVKEALDKIQTQER